MPNAEEAAADARWITDAWEGLQLHADVRSDLDWSVHVEARLGALGTTWVQEALEVDADGVLRVTLDPPEAALLDPVATDYVTDLRVRLHGTDAAGRVITKITAPAAFLAWPDGAGGAPVVWDREAMELEAPAGVVSDAVRASFGDLNGIDRVIPPIERTTPIPLDDFTTGG